MAEDTKAAVAEETKEETAAPEATEQKEEAPAETATEEKKEEVKEEKKEEVKKDVSDVDETVEIPKEFKKLVEEIEKMTVLELNELVKVLEKRFGVSAAAVAVAGGGVAGDDAGGEEQTEFTVELTDAGAQKIAVIKVVKAACGLGLKEAKDMVDGAPADVKAGLKKEDAEALKAELEGAGATVTLK